MSNNSRKCRVCEKDDCCSDLHADIYNEWKEVNDIFNCWQCSKEYKLNYETQSSFCSHDCRVKFQNAIIGD